MLSVFLPPLEARDRSFIPRAMVRSSFLALFSLGLIASLAGFVLALSEGGEVLRPLGVFCLVLFVLFAEVMQWESGLWYVRKEQREVSLVMRQANDLAREIGQPLSAAHVFLAASFHAQGSAQLSRLLVQPQALDEVVRSSFYRELERPLADEQIEGWQRTPSVRSLWYQAYLESLTIPAVLDGMGVSRRHVQWLQDWYAVQQRLRSEQEELTTQASLWPHASALNALLPKTSVLARYATCASLDMRQGHTVPALHQEKEVERFASFLEPGLSPVLIKGEEEDCTLFLDRLVHYLCRGRAAHATPALQVFRLSLADIMLGEVSPEEELASLAEEMRALPKALFLFEDVAALWSPDPDVRAERGMMLERCFRAAAWPVLVPVRSEEEEDIRALVPFRRFHVVSLDPVSRKERFLSGELGSVEYETGVFFSAQAVEALIQKAISFEQIRERARALAREMGRGLVIDPSMVKDWM